MNKKGELTLVTAIVLGTIIFGQIINTTFNYTIQKTQEGDKTYKVEASDLTRKNMKTIWCKMQAKKDCNF